MDSMSHPLPAVASNVSNDSGSIGFVQENYTG